MSTIEAIVLRRVTFDKITLKSGALALHNYQMGFARGDKALIMRDDTGGFHEFSSDAINDEKYFSGRGTLNAIPKFTDTGTIGDSSLTDDGTTIGWSTATAPNIGSLSKPFLNAYSSGYFEGGVSLASKYAAISHNQAISTITGLSSALDTINATLEGKLENKRYVWTCGNITASPGWAKIISVTLPNSTTTNYQWIFNVYRIGSFADKSPRVGILNIGWRNGELIASFVQLSGSFNVSKFGYTGTLAKNTLFEVYGYSSEYPYLTLEPVEASAGVVEGGTFSPTDPSMKYIDTKQVLDKDYADTIYAAINSTMGGSNSNVGMELNIKPNVTHVWSYTGTGGVSWSLPDGGVNGITIWITNANSNAGAGSITLTGNIRGISSISQYKTARCVWHTTLAKWVITV